MAVLFLLGIIVLIVVAGGMLAVFLLNRNRER